MVNPASTPVAGDVCATATAVTPDGGPVTINRAGLQSGSDVGTSCGTSTGTGATYTDAVYQFDVRFDAGGKVAHLSIVAVESPRVRLLRRIALGEAGA